ncbi:MAG: S8 family serine peptidase [Austwickia sp.]|nr:S8 family serine peptidase [Austwickia sp.]
MRTPFRRPLVAGASVLLAGTALAAIPPAAVAAGSAADDQRSYLVLASLGASDQATRDAIRKAGGSISTVNEAVGLYTVTAPADSFAAAASALPAVAGVSRERRIGSAPDRRLDPQQALERMVADRAAMTQAATTPAVKAPVAKAPTAKAPTADAAPTPAPGQAPSDPLAPRQWNMELIRAWRAHTVETGHRVRVGIMDTGVDAAHPDIKPNFNYTLSRNFTVDMPDIDGPCEDEADASCTDAPTVDENGHGTHVAGTIASPRNGVGIVGVAPDAEIVNLRSGQDSGYFFVKPTVDALTYAGDQGIDVVNMSFYIDPWLFNCTANPKDSPEQQAEQQMVIQVTQRALAYARDRGVTLVAAAGNEHLDLDNPREDTSSPDYPEGTNYPRPIDNSSCLSLPNEGQNVISVSSVGPSTLKADYSNWGYDGVDVAAPGGYFNDGFGTPTYKNLAKNTILAPMPRALALEDPLVDKETGESRMPLIVAECTGTTAATCSYYQYLQGTSMASPHAAGVAALIVGRWGKKRNAYDAITMAPKHVERILTRTATATPCPRPLFTYPDRSVEYNATCVGSVARNSWYGHGIVDALTAVTRRN